MFIKVASSPRLSGIGMPSQILWSHPLKMQRIVLLSSLLWWELGTNSLITGPGEWLSFRRFTSKLSWSWSPLFIPQLTHPTLQSPLPIPVISSPPSPFPIYPTLLSRLYPTILAPLLPSPRIPSLPTYLPLHHYHTLEFPTLRSPHTRLLAYPPLSSPTLPCSLSYHIPQDSPAPTLLYSPLYYSSLASPPLPTYPLWNVSFPTSLGYLNPSLLYPPLPYLPNTPYPTLPINFLPFHSSTLVSYPLRSSPLP